MGASLCMNKHKHQCAQCECSLKQYNHCCKQDCFPYKQTQRPQLLKSLKYYNAEYLIDLIIDYLPDDQHEIIEINSPDTNHGYNAFCHATTSLCPIWLKHHFMDKNKIKIAILGHKGIGKTSLMMQYTTNTFIDDYDDPFPDQYEKQITINHQECMLDIADYTGQEMVYSAFYDHLIRERQIFLCCFAINSRESYERALIDRQKILRCKDGYNNYGIILVATKCDLWDQEQYKTNTNNITTLVDRQQVIEQAKQWNIGYIETSAKMNMNINFLFKQSVLEYWIQSETHKCWDEELESESHSISQF